MSWTGRLLRRITRRNSSRDSRRGSRLGCVSGPETRGQESRLRRLGGAGLRRLGAGGGDHGRMGLDRNIAVERMWS